MAMETKVSTQLRLVLHAGDDMVSGKPILKAKSFNQVKTVATAEELFAVASALAGLQDFPLHNIERRDNSDISAG